MDEFNFWAACKASVPRKGQQSHCHCLALQQQLPGQQLAARQSEPDSARQSGAYQTAPTSPRNQPNDRDLERQNLSDPQRANLMDDED